MVIPPCAVFDPEGVSGLWDVMHSAVGTKIVTANTSIPWVILTRTRVGVAVHSNGTVQLQLGGATIEAAQVVEDILISRFGGQWENETEARKRDTNAVVYGRQGRLAMEAKCSLRGAVFR